MDGDVDSAEFGRLIEPLLNQAAGYALSILRNRQDAEDAVQQAALRGLSRIATFDARQPFKGWWFSILRNCCVDILRRRQSSLAVALGRREAQDESGFGTRRWEALAEALEALSREHREILRLRYFGGLTYRELASALDVPDGTVMSRLHFARKALMDQMSTEEQ
jgi:RNA polymerase sigma-70 factor (ECF subfamily)